MLRRAEMDELSNLSLLEDLQALIENSRDKVATNQKTVHCRELFLYNLAPLALVTNTPGVFVTLRRERRPDAPPVRALL